MSADHDPSFDTSLFLDGNVFVIDPSGGHWVKFEVKRADVTAERPHGLRYSLTLHAADGARLVGFDNAHRGHRIGCSLNCAEREHKANTCFGNSAEMIHPTPFRCPPAMDFGLAVFGSDSDAKPFIHWQVCRS